MPRQAPQPVFTVLLVCTGNICRSALAERLGEAYLIERLGDASAQVRLASAGTQAVVGAPMHPNSALALKGLGGHPEGFRARQFREKMVAESDFVLALTRAHRREVLELAPRALARTFTLREANDLRRLVADVEVPGSGLPERSRALVRRMGAARSSRRSGPSDDICDPVGQPSEVHLAVGEMVADALLPLLSRFVSFASPVVAGEPDEG